MLLSDTFVQHFYWQSSVSHGNHNLRRVPITLLINLSLLFITFDSILLLPFTLQYIRGTVAITICLLPWYICHFITSFSNPVPGFMPVFCIFKSVRFPYSSPTNSFLFFINQPLLYYSPTKLHLFLIMVQSASSKSKALHVKTGPPTKKPHNKKSVHNGKCSCFWVLMNLILNVYRWECRSCLWETYKHQSEWVCLFK